MEKIIFRISLYQEIMALKILLLWIWPALATKLTNNNMKLFLDGTFKIVPRTFTQCINIMVHDTETNLFLPIASIKRASFD